MTDIEKIVGSSSEYRGDSSENVHPTSSGMKKQEKREDYVTETDYTRDDISSDGQKVQRGMKSRHISMIAIGGTIGTGLFISTGLTLSYAGPVSALISFLFMTTLTFSVTQSLGEMATYIPVTGSFAQFVGRWCSPAFGAANGYCYWFSWSVTYGLELSVVGQVIQKWTHVIPLAAWIGIFFVILTAANLVPVKYYGEIEFWIASMKVIAIVGWIIYAFIMVCGAGKTGPVGFRYWRNPGPWGPGLYVKDVNAGRFLGWLSSLISAAFTFQGCELVGITAGECKNPHKTLPSAIRKVLFRILVFYVLCMLFIGLLVPYNDPQLHDNGNFSASSPFVIAIKNSGTKVLPDVFNVVILSTIISAGNSDVYCGSRILYGLAEAGMAPKILRKASKQGVPYVAVLVTASCGLLGFMATSKQGSNAFSWFVNITATASLISWGFISFTHIRFMNVLKSRGISRDSLPFKAMFMPYSAYYSAIAIFILTFVQGYSAFFDFNISNFFVAYISVILFVLCYIFFHFFFNGLKRTPILVPIDECDIDTGVRTIEEEEWDEAEDQKPMNAWQKFWDWVS